jgi:hypothetical protein
MALRDLGNTQDQLHGLPFVVPAEASNARSQLLMLKKLDTNDMGIKTAARYVNRMIF